MHKVYQYSGWELRKTHNCDQLAKSNDLKSGDSHCDRQKIGKASSIICLDKTIRLAMVLRRCLILANFQAGSAYSGGAYKKKRVLYHLLSNID